MISIDYSNKAPIYEQIVNSVEKLIVLGIWKEDDKLPSVRSLGIELSTNPNTIQKAYTILENRGVIYTVKGIGNFVAKNDLKSKKIDDILNETKELIKSAVCFGLNEEEFNKWYTNLKEEIYDKGK